VISGKLRELHALWPTHSEPAQAIGSRLDEAVLHENLSHEALADKIGTSALIRSDPVALG